MKKRKQQSFGMSVVVEDGKFEKALRQFKKKVEDSGLLQEVKERQQFVKPNVERKLKRNAAKKRSQKKLRQESLPTKLY